MPTLLAAASAEVVVPGVDGQFSYRVPTRWKDIAMPGMRVVVPFGHRRMTGTIVSVSAEGNPKATREIEHVLDDRPVFTPELLKFTQWISEYYLCAWGDVLKAALPAGIALDEKRHWVASEAADADVETAYRRDYPQAGPILDALKQNPQTPDQILKQFGQGPRAALLRKMQEAGLIVYRPVLKAPKVKSHFDSVVTLAPEILEKFGPDLLGTMRSVHEQNLLREIHSAGPDGILRSDLLKGSNPTRKKAFAKLMAANSFELRMEEVTRWNPDRENTPVVTEPEILTDYQNNAIAAITESLTKGAFDPFLLYGVTGSGKTQVYIEAIRHALAMGKSSLILLPEIALTPFVWGRFYQAFGNRVAIQHSAQSPIVRFDLWRDIRNGKFPVVVGARSAVFAPLENLGLIVVDEEQEGSFKQEEPAPRYHARDAALMRARMENAVIVLGSATPSVETLHHAQSGKYHLLTLPERVGGAYMPHVIIVPRLPHFEMPEEKKDDGQAEAEKGKGGKSKRVEPKVVEPPTLTDELIEYIGATLERKKQAILLQNRRGFSPFLICKVCGYVPMCPECSVSLTYHRKGVVLRCHYCDHREPAIDTCPKCGSKDIVAYGLGTQKLEEEVASHFPEARILRMDSDTASRRGMHGRMVAAFAAGDYDLLVGTQMVAKGLDFPNVELSAVIQADAELFFPDFRSSERSASLIVQVAGRAGRRARTGTVIIQSSVTDHPVLNIALDHDWGKFVQGELESREHAGFPPFARLVLLRAIGKDESETAKALLRLRRLLQQGGGVALLGPAPAVVAKIRGLFRYQLLVRTLRTEDPSGNRLRNAVRIALTSYRQMKEHRGVEIEVDVDPQTVT
jgi:primosomal protein N' (replication factor Y)